VGDVDVIILHPLPGPGAGPLGRALADARAALAERHRAGFLAAGATTARVVAGEPDGIPFGRRLRTLVADLTAGHGLVLLGSGALPLATTGDRLAFLAAAAGPGRRALANNRYSADVLALTADAAAALPGVPTELPGDNALPRWLDEVAGVEVADLRGRWRLAVDLDSPLDVLLAASGRGCPPALRAAAASLPGPDVVLDRLPLIRAVLADPRAELVVCGRTSAATLGWLERHARCRVRALVEERGMRASSRLARADRAGTGPLAAQRPPRSVLGAILDHEGPGALGARLAELGDAALVDSRVLLGHRLGAEESAWPTAEDRFASDLLLAAAVVDPWLAELTASAADAPIPVLLGGHSLVGPGVRLVGWTVRVQASA
jgi:hypothetical protein